MKYYLANSTNKHIRVRLIRGAAVYNANMKRSQALIVNIKRANIYDILPHFNGSVEEAYSAIKDSPDILRAIRSGQLSTYALDNRGRHVNIDAVLGVKKKDTSKSLKKLLDHKKAKKEAEEKEIKTEAEEATITEKASEVMPTTNKKTKKTK